MKKYLVVILAVLIGLAGIVAGEADDSPGLQLLGAIIVVTSIALGVRTGGEASKSHDIQRTDS